MVSGGSELSLGMEVESEGNGDWNQSAFYRSRLEPVEPPDWQ